MLSELLLFVILRFFVFFLSFLDQVTWARSSAIEQTNVVVGARTYSIHLRLSFRVRFQHNSISTFRPRSMSEPAEEQQQHVAKVNGKVSAELSNNIAQHSEGESNIVVGKQGKLVLQDGTL